VPFSLITRFSEFLLIKRIYFLAKETFLISHTLLRLSIITSIDNFIHQLYFVALSLLICSWERCLVCSLQNLKSLNWCMWYACHFLCFYELITRWNTCSLHSIYGIYFPIFFLVHTDMKQAYSSLRTRQKKSQ
jgi:hypothetical protein